MANTNKSFKPIKTLFDTFTIILCNRDHTKLGKIKNVDFSSIHLKGELANGNDVSFDVYHELDGEKEPLWDELVDLKLIYIPEIEDYLEITITDYDSVEKKKSIVGVNAGIAELSQTQLYNLEINTPEDILNTVQGYTRTTFYNRTNPKASLLHRVLEKVPQYSIGHVPVSVAAKFYAFSVNDKSVWEFLSKDVAEAFDVLFVIDNVNKVINVYDLLIVCNDCQTRQQPHYEYGYYDDVAYAEDSDLSIVTDSDNAWLYGNDRIVAYKRLTCEKCGSENLDYFGEDTHILIDKENLTDEIQLTIDTDSIKNTFKLEAGDDYMTATIVALNPNGSQYINMFNELDYADMPKALVDRLNNYSALYDSYKNEYSELMENYYVAVDNKLKYQSGLMPSQGEQTITAQTEAAKLIADNLSPMGLTRVTESTTVQSVNSSIAQLAKVFVKTGYVKVEVDMTEIPAVFTYVGEDVENHHYGTWTGRFLVTSYSDSEDTAYSPTITVVVNDDYEQYLNQKIAKNIVRYDDKEGSIYDVLRISSYNDFVNAITYYCVNRLISFRDAISNCLNILVQEGHGSHIKGKDPDTGSDVVDEFYDDIYVPYYNKLLALEDEIGRRQSGLEPDGSVSTRTDGYGEPYSTANVDYWTNLIGIMDDGTILPNSYEARKREIQDILDLEKNIGGYYYRLYCAYRREQTYSNSNYISTDLDNAKVFENAQKFLEAANEELLKASTPQYTVKCNLFNLLPVNGYEIFKEKFVLGNWIRVIADDQLFRLRLLSFSIDFSNFNNIDVEFSNVTKIGNIMTDVESILSSAKSMATSYGATMKQAEAGNNANEELGEFVNNGLISSLSNIKSNVDEEITFGKFGIYAKSYDPDTESYDPKQLRITHNILAFTDDNWQSAKAALGEHDYTYYNPDDDAYEIRTGYGLTAEFVQAGHVNGSTIIGGNIYSQNYSVTRNTGSHIDLDHGTFSFGGDKLTYNGSNLVIKDGSIQAGSIIGSTIDIGDGTFTVNSSGHVYASDINIHGAVAAGGSITGAVIAGGTIKVPNSESPNFQVNADGTMTCKGATINGHITNGNGFDVTADGYLTSTSGTIGGWTLGDNKIYSNNVSLMNNGDIRCWISGENEPRWAIYNNGNATFSNITATGGTFNNVTIDGYVTTQELNAFNLVVEGRLSAVTADIGTLTADKANIDDLTTGTLTVQESVNAQNLDVNGTVSAGQLRAGTINGHTVSWQQIMYVSTIRYKNLYQSTSDKTIKLSSSASEPGYNKIGEVVDHGYIHRLYILAEDTEV